MICIYGTFWKDVSAEGRGKKAFSRIHPWRIYSKDKIMHMNYADEL